MRIGIGFDVHQLVPDRKLILGGVDIPHSTGLLGHSDADVLIHAIIDAILGAASLGDIGTCFPDSDDQYKGISSIILLERALAFIKENGWRVGNIDSVIMAEKPKLLPYIQLMRQNIALAVDIGIDRVSVKATTTEKLGFIGREEGIAVQSVALLRKAM